MPVIKISTSGVVVDFSDQEWTEEVQIVGAGQLVITHPAAEDFFAEAFAFVRRAADLNIVGVELQLPVDGWRHRLGSL
jgi:hypothetical protein